MCGNAEGAAAWKESPGLFLTPSDGTEPLMMFWVSENRDSALHASLWAYGLFPLGLAASHGLTRHFNLSCRLTRASLCIRSPLISWRSRCTPWSLWCCRQWATWSSRLAECRGFLSRRFCCALRSRGRFSSVETSGIWRDVEGFRELRRAYPRSVRSDTPRYGQKTQNST